MRTGIWSAVVGVVALVLTTSATWAGELREATPLPAAETPRALEPTPPAPAPVPGPEACAQVSEQVRQYQADRAELDRVLVDNHRTIVNWLYGWDNDLWRNNNRVLHYNGTLGRAAGDVNRVIPNIQQEQQRLQGLFQAVANCVGYFQTHDSTQPMPVATGQPFEPTPQPTGISLN